jgi:hypothetical protein
MWKGDAEKDGRDLAQQMVSVGLQIALQIQRLIVSCNAHTKIAFLALGNVTHKGTAMELVPQG